VSRLRFDRSCDRVCGKRAKRPSGMLYGLWAMGYGSCDNVTMCINLFWLRFFGYLREYRGIPPAPPLSRQLALVERRDTAGRAAAAAANGRHRRPSVPESRPTPVLLEARIHSGPCVDPNMLIGFSPTTERSIELWAIDKK
jgi:hypothetical protein